MIGQRIPRIPRMHLSTLPWSCMKKYSVSNACMINVGQSKSLAIYLPIHVLTYAGSIERKLHLSRSKHGFCNMLKDGSRLPLNLHPNVLKTLSNRKRYGTAFSIRLFRLLMLYTMFSSNLSANQVYIHFPWMIFSGCSTTT